MRSKLLLSLGLLSYAATSFGQSALTPSSFNKEKFLNKITALQQAAAASAQGGKTTGTGQRLVGISNYDYNASQLMDSSRLKYSGTRTSNFDFDELIYNLDYYYPALGSATFVYYDTVRQFDPPGSSSSTVAGSMAYNTSGKVTQNAYYYPMGGGRTDFSYDAQGRISRAFYLDYDPINVTWDSSYRTYFFYDAQSRLVKDSSEAWDGSSWAPDMVTKYTNNAAGFPIKGEVSYDIGIGYLTVFEININYTPLNKMSKMVFRVLGNSMTLEDQSKDTFGYVGAMQVYRDSYNWDSATNGWLKYAEERRRLNSAGLPDSVVRNDINPMQTNTMVTKLAYNTAGLPVYQRNFYNMPPVAADDEERYYYETFNLSVGNTPKAASIRVYPNPAGNSLNVTAFEGAKGGMHYAVVNSAGQTVQASTFPAGSAANQSLSLGALPAGNYFVIASDAAGQRATAPFVKQ